MSDTIEQTKADLLILAQERKSARERYIGASERLADLVQTAHDLGISKREIRQITKVTPATVTAWVEHGSTP